MPLPASFARDGFGPASESRNRRCMPGLKRPGVMIGTEGETNTGKSEFILSCPGPGIVLAVDRMIDGCLDNPNPPASRNDNFAIDEIMLSTMTMAENHQQNWANFMDRYLKALRNPDARTVAIDGDDNTWETQRLAAFGTLTQIPSIRYTEVNAARRAMIARAYDSGKVIVATNKIVDEYAVKRDAEGNPVVKDGKEVREKSGRKIRKGFDDDNYLWHIQLRHLYEPARTAEVAGKIRTFPHKWGIRILKCKTNPGLIGEELWGDDCNFSSLIQLAYPHVKLEEWGL